MTHHFPWQLVAARRVALAAAVLAFWQALMGTVNAAEPARLLPVPVNQAANTLHAVRPPALMKQVSPALAGVGGKRFQDLQAEHRALAAVAKSSAARSGIDVGAIQSPHVGSVNGRGFASTWIVPGAPYVFKGKGFGGVPGTVSLVGNFPNAAPTFRIDLWLDDEIHTYLEGHVSGALDQEGIKLVVNTPGGPIVKEGVKFYAAREVRQIDMQPYRRVVGDGASFAATPSVSKADGFLVVERNGQRGHTGCPAPSWSDENGGYDDYRLPALRPGWEAAGYEWYSGPVDFGQGDGQGGPGYRRTDGRYEVRWDPPQIDVRWATLNTRSAPPCPAANRLWSYSAYKLRVYLSGPLGTTAY